MGHQVFEWIIAIAVLVVFMANMVFLAVIYKMLKPLISKLQATNDKINPILSEVQGIISDNRGKIAAIVSESQPVVRNIMTKTDDIAGTVRGIINDNRGKVSAIVSEAQPFVRDIGTKASDIAVTVRSILGEAQGIISDNRPKVSAIISDVQPVVRDIGTKTNDITSAARDMVLTVKNQVERLDAIVKGVSDKIDETASILQSQVIEPVAMKVNDITDTAHNQVVEIGALMRDTALALKGQAERLDDLVRRMTDKIDLTTTTVQRQVTEPVREINHLGVAIKRAISTLFDRDSKTVS